MIKGKLSSANMLKNLLRCAVVLFPALLQAQIPAPTSIRIGVVLPLSGVGASFGQRALQGLELAHEEINKESRYQLVLLVEDSASQSARAATAAQKLISANHVKVVIGDIRSDCVLAMAPITERHKVLLFTPVAGAEAISFAGDYVFRNHEGNLSHGKTMADYLHGRGIRRVTVFAAQASNAASFATSFEKQFIERGGQVPLTADYLPDTGDFRALISRPLALKPEALYLAPTMGEDAGLLVKQIRQAGYKGIIAAGLPVESAEFLAAGGAAADGVIFTSPAFDSESKLGDSFRSRMKKRFGTLADWVAAYSYDALRLVAAGIESCESDSSDCLRDYLYQIRNYSGVGGLTSFDRNGDVIKPLLIKIVRNGSFEKLPPRSLSE